MRILIVEDEVNAREGLGNLLGKISEEYVVCGKASNGEQGLKLAKELKPDLIFTDIRMPKFNGLEMIEKIKEEGLEPYFVILSGYSDFKYAQTGIKLGVEEYLLKPITYNNLKDSMIQMKNKINLKKEKVGILRRDMPKEEILGEILLNRGEISEYAYKLMEDNIKQDKNMYLINLHLREKYKEKNELIIKEIYNFIKYEKIETFYHSTITDYNYLSFFINTKISFQEIIKKLKYNLLFYLRKNALTDVTVSITNLNELVQIKDSLNKLQNLSKWPIVLGNDEIVHQEYISSLKIIRCNYPRDIENEALSAIKNNDYSKLENINNRFILYLKTNVYNPLDVIEICCKYVFSILTYAKNCNNNLYNEIKSVDILNQIRNSCTLEEIKEQLSILIDKVCKKNNDNWAINSLTVRRTINYINEYYNDKISLEEIASGMNITPEYLSRLFSKEVGKSFSEYLKEYRIDKAKRMLINDKMKIYEIAEKVGYSDSKYFCRVFKELMGMSPKEYMKFH